jgi:hypothetical protein
MTSKYVYLSLCSLSRLMICIQTFPVSSYSFEPTPFSRLSIINYVNINAIWPSSVATQISCKSFLADV